MGLKTDIRRVLADRDDDLGLDIHPDDLNAVTNAVWKLVRQHIETEVERGGFRNLSLGFISSGDARKPITVRVQVEDDVTNTIMTSLDLSEHEFAGLLAGRVLKIKDSL